MPPSEGATTAVDLSAKKFLQLANICSQKEVLVATLAETRTTNAAVQSYAGRIKTDHQKLNSDLAKLGVTLGEPALASNLFAASALDVSQSSPTKSKRQGRNVRVTPLDVNDSRAHLEAARNSVAKLSKLSGSRFDTAFAEMMVADHEAAIALFDQASRSVEDEAVRDFALEALPILQQHLAATGILERRLEMRLSSIQ